MKISIKITLLIGIVMLAAITVLGCTGSQTGPAPTQADPVVGTWVYTAPETSSLSLVSKLTFNTDHSYHAELSIAGNSITGDGTWSNIGNGLYKVSFSSEQSDSGEPYDTYAIIENGKLYPLDNQTDTNRVVAHVRLTDDQAMSSATVQTSNTPSANNNPGDVGFSRSTPAPIGTPITYNYELTQYGSQTGDSQIKVHVQERVTILDVKRGYTAVEALLNDEGKRQYETYYKTDDRYMGFEPLLIKVKYEIISVDQELNYPISRSDSYFGLVASNGTVYQYGSTAPMYYDLYKYGLDTFDFKSYGPSSAEGYIMLTVSTDDPAPEVECSTGDWGSVKHTWFKTVP